MTFKAAFATLCTVLADDSNLLNGWANQQKKKDRQLTDGDSIPARSLLWHTVYVYAAGRILGSASDRL